MDSVLNSMALNGPMVSNTEAGNSLDPDQPDFTLLPLPLWLKIFSYLEEQDQLALSATCRALYDLCMKSSVLWRSTTITIGSKTPSSGIDNDEAALNQTEQSILGEHCHQMNNITLLIKTTKTLNFDERSYSLLEDSAKCWPLLSFHAWFVIGHDHTDPVILKHTEHLLTACLTSPNAGQLTTLTQMGQKWVNEQGKSVLLEALKNSSFTSSLTCLSFMHCLPYCYDHSCELCRVVGRFTNLQQLGIDLSNVCNTLLDNFPKHIKKMLIAVNGLEDFKEVINWQTLRAACPQLNVKLYFSGNGSHQTLPKIQILPSVVPVTTVNSIPIYRQGIHYSIQKEILQLLPLYSRNLSVLTCGKDSIKTTACKDKALISTVSQCPKLDHLHVYDSISSHTIVKLAKMRKWIELKFEISSIIYDDSSDRDEGLQTLSVEVSKILGRDFEWKLLSAPVRDSNTVLYNKPLQMKMRQQVITV